MEYMLGVDMGTTSAKAEANVSVFFYESSISMSHRYKDNGTIVCIFEKREGIT